jgi:hypothetical protein
MEKYAIKVNFPINKVLDNQNFTAFSMDNIPGEISALGVCTYCKVSTLTKQYRKYLKYPMPK